MANMNVEVSDELIANLKKLGYEIVRIGNPKNGEIFLTSIASDNRVCEHHIIVAERGSDYNLRVIVRRILKWPPFLGDDCAAFLISTGGNYSSSVLFLYDTFGNYTTVKLTMLSYDFREYPVSVKFTRKDCAT